MGLHRAVYAACGTTNGQNVLGVDFRAPNVANWITQLLWNLGLVQDVVESQQKCANTPTAWEGPDGYGT